MKKNNSSLFRQAQEAMFSCFTFAEILRIQNEFYSKVDKSNLDDQIKEHLKINIQKMTRLRLINISNTMFNAMNGSCLFLIFNKFCMELNEAIHNEHLQWKDLPFTEKSIAERLYETKRRGLIKVNPDIEFW